MITINKEIVQDIKSYSSLKKYCRLIIDYNKEEEIAELQEKIFNYFKKLNNSDYNDSYYYNDFYLSNESIETIITVIDEKLRNDYKGNFFLYSDKEIFYTIFNEYSYKDTIIINLLETLDNPINYLLLNIFCEPSSPTWYNNIFEIRYNIALTTEILKYNCYKDN